MAKYVLLMIIIIIGNLIADNFFSRADALKQESKQEVVKLDNASKHEELKMPYEGAIKLKIASRKLDYHLGEIISLDIAALNFSDEPLHILALTEVEILVRKNSGKTVNVIPYYLNTKLIDAEHYKILQPRKMIVEWIPLHIGCEKRIFKEMKDLASSMDDEEGFRKSLFTNWGKLCLQISQPGDYVITVNQKNNYVLLPSGSEKKRTVVGSLKSNTLAIRVIK